MRTLTNQRGSVLTVAIVMVAILTFSLTSLSAYTLRTAENTSRSVERNFSENVAKRSIDQAMNDLEFGMRDILEEEGMEYFKGLGEDDWQDLELINEIEADTGVVIEEDEESRYSTDEFIVRKFLIIYPREDGRDMVRELYLSNHTVFLRDNEDAFLFSVGTDGTLAINGGNYAGSDNIYGQTILAGHDTVIRNADGSYDIDRPGKGNLPGGAEDSYFSTRDLRYCPEGEECLQFKEDTDDKFVFENYQDIRDHEDFSDDFEYRQYYDNIFGGFDFDNYFFTTFDSKIDDLSGISRNNYDAVLSDGLDEGVFYDLSEDEDYETVDDELQVDSMPILPFDTLVDGDARFDFENPIDFNGNTLIIHGDLTIERMDELSQETEIFVTGDIHIEKSHNMRLFGNLYALGEIVVDFEGETGFENPGPGPKSEGGALIADGHIRILNSYSAKDEHGGTSTRVPLFILSRQSVLIHATDKTHFGGTVFALAQGDPLDNHYVRNDEGELEALSGIVIHSLKNDGPIADGAPFAWSETYDPNNNGGGGGGGPPWGGNGPPPWSGPGTDPDSDDPGGFIRTVHSAVDDSGHSFSINHIRNIHPGGQSSAVEESFDDIPVLEPMVLEIDNSKLFSQRSTYFYARDD